MRLSGLILAGGRSRRMGFDKAALVFGGSSQLSRAVKAAEGVCDAVFLSLREEQDMPSNVPGGVVGVVRDRFGDTGPLGGILSAFDAYPGRAWLVLVIDLPFAGEQVIERLVAARDAQKHATAYRSSKDGLPEPMCAIYEASSGAQLMDLFVNHNVLSPRRILMSLDVHLLDPADEWALDNVNTPEDYEEARKRVERAGIVKKISLQYFAVLRESRGLSREIRETDADTARLLYDELRQAYGFQLSPTDLKVAVNGDFQDLDHALQDGDEVVFIPPVAGG